MGRMSIGVFTSDHHVIQKEGELRVRRMTKICGGAKSAFFLFFVLRCLATVKVSVFRICRKSALPYWAQRKRVLSEAARFQVLE